MPERTKRIFISDIHMGDERSWTAPHSYVWFEKNVSLLADFLNDILQSPDVKELIILGDLFDKWIVPADYTPIAGLATICSSRVYAPVIAALKALAADRDIGLTYVPGNHDMALGPAGINANRQFLEDFFKGMNFICEETLPLGIYRNGTIVAEHGNRYCLFNAPDIESNSGASFLPLGYFIARLDACKACRSGRSCSVFDTFIKMVEEYLAGNTNFVEDVFLAVARDCGKGNGGIDTAGLPGYADSISVGDLASRFARIADRWGRIPGTRKVDAVMAAKGDQLGLFSVAKAVYFEDAGPRVVIFGHTHKAEMLQEFENPSNPDFICDPDTSPCRTIYVNSGAWVDSAAFGCTYVEVEEVENRLYVRVRAYPGKNVLNGWRGFVQI